MKKIKYRIRFFSEWHCSSGLAAGMDMDLLVIKDESGLPFIPGKTMKGLLREAVEELFDYTDRKDHTILFQMFGYSGQQIASGGVLDMDTTAGSSFFSDATLSPALKEKVRQEKGLAEYFYCKNSFTAIDRDGIAKEGTLRQIQTTIPCELYGSISNVPLLDFEVKNVFSYVKRIGLNRNRGLGRCCMELVSMEDEA